VIDEIVTNTQSPRKNRCWATFFPGPSSSRGRTGPAGRIPPQMFARIRRPPLTFLAPRPNRISPAGGGAHPSLEHPRPPAQPATRRAGEALYPLLSAARGGHEAGLVNLAGQVRALLVRSVAPKLAGGWAEAFTEDVVGGAMVGVLRGFAGCRAGCEGELRNWIAAITRREIATIFRHEAGRQHRRVPLRSSLPAAGRPDAPVRTPR
jgi:hypothetical protein